MVERRTRDGSAGRLLVAAAALAVHLLVLALLGVQLQPPGAQGDVAVAHPHAPFADEGFDTRDPLFDLTPPEVRSLGSGGGMAEHLDAAPALVAPARAGVVASTEPMRHGRLDDTRRSQPERGRAPPVR